MFSPASFKEYLENVLLLLDENSLGIIYVDTKPEKIFERLIKRSAQHHLLKNLKMIMTD